MQFNYVCIPNSRVPTVQTIKAFRAKYRRSSTRSELDTRWRKVVSFMLRPFTAGTPLTEGWMYPRAGKDVFFIQCHHMSLWTSWSSLLGMAVV
jgi:hypothetical protein